MAMGPVLLNGIVTRTQDYTAIKHHEDQKPVIDQNNIQTKFQQEVRDHVMKVHQGDDADFENKKFDAKEKGNQSYQGDGGKARHKKDEVKKDGKVIVKEVSCFDIKI